LGQWYNREGQKGICLALAGLVNLLIFSGLWWLLQDPQSALLTLLSWGLLLGPNPVGLIQTLQQSPVLPLMGTLMVSLSLLGAVDAYWVARTNRFDYLQAPSLRVSWVQSVALAYGGHLLALLLLVLVPILGGGGSGHAHQPPTPGSEPLIFDLVSEPTTLTGHAQAPAGKPQGQDSRNRTAQPLTQPSHGLTGNRVKPRPATPSQTAKGIAHSYNDYISGELRREQERYDQYFAHLLPGEYTVLRYHVGTDGEIYDIEILPDHTTAPPNVSQLAMEQIQHLSPLLPPPSQGRELIVTELFWQFDQVGPAGSLEEKLSQLPDGRMIEVAD
jgi:hypothetical protein